MTQHAGCERAADGELSIHDQGRRGRPSPTREHATQMSAKLSIESLDGEGVRVTLCIPARIAYASFEKARRFFWARRPKTTS